MPMVSLEADRLQIIVAPAAASPTDGVAGTHRSSQISTPNANSGNSAHLSTTRLPNGARPPAQST